MPINNGAQLWWQTFHDSNPGLAWHRLHVLPDYLRRHSRNWPSWPTVHADRIWNKLKHGGGRRIGNESKEIPKQVNNHHVQPKCIDLLMDGHRHQCVLARFLPSTGMQCSHLELPRLRLLATRHVFTNSHSRLAKDGCWEGSAVPGKPPST